MEQNRRTVKRRSSSTSDSSQKRNSGQSRTAQENTKITDIRGYRKRRRRAGSTRWVRVLLLFILCIVGGYYFSLSAFFDVEEIVVTGNETVSDEAIKRSSGVNLGDNIFSVSLDRVEQWTRINYMVASAQAVKELPNRILIAVTERYPVAIVPVDGGFLEVDKDGIVIARLKEMDKPVLPLLTGLEEIAPGTVLGAKIFNEADTTNNNSEKCLAALAVAAQMSDEAKEFITEINAANTQKIVIYTKDNTEVRIGSQEGFPEKFEAFYALLAAQEEEGLLPTISYVDISLVSSPAIFYAK